MGLEAARSSDRCAFRPPSGSSGVRRAAGLSSVNKAGDPYRSREGSAPAEAAGSEASPPEGVTIRGTWRQ